MKTAPFYLDMAADIPQTNQEQALSRFKLVVGYAISIRQFTAQMQKPFNPVLGETYQAHMGKYEVALEQISHHPPISCYQVWSEKHSKWQIHGYMEYRPVITLTSAGGHGYGPLTVEFEDGH